MCKKVVLTGLVGGAVFFIWSSFSWMVLPWHQSTLNTFKNSSQVARVLSANTNGPGVYVIPGLPKDIRSQSTKQRERSMKSFNRSITQGPLAFVAYSKVGGDPNMRKELGLWFLMAVVAASLIASLLWCGKESMSYTCRVGFVATIGVLVGILGNMPDYVWWHHGIHFPLINFFDDVIGWTLAGLVMAKLMTPKNNSAQAS